MGHRPLSGLLWVASGLSWWWWVCHLACWYITMSVSWGSRSVGSQIFHRLGPSWFSLVFVTYCGRVILFKVVPCPLPSCLTSVSWWAFRLFPLFGYYAWCCCEYACTRFCVDRGVHSPGVYSRLELPVHVMTMYNLWRSCFLKPFTVLRCVRTPSYSVPLQQNTTARAAYKQQKFIPRSSGGWKV